MMKKRAIFAAIGALAVSAAIATGASARGNATSITGAGSTFVAPLIAQWVSPVGSAFGYTLNYSPIGSGGGIAAITNRTSTSVRATHRSRPISSRPARAASRFRGRYPPLPWATTSQA
jgi:ABC-type phosphate transport system substrate-binding protein